MRVPLVLSLLRSLHRLACPVTLAMAIVATGQSGMAQTPAVTLGPTLNIVAGNGIPGYSGDGGLAINAEIAPDFIAFDGAGNYYFSDDSDSVVRKVDAKTGVVTRVAGTGTGRGYSGDGGPATSAELNTIEDIAVDTAGDIYIGDGNNYNVRKVDASTGIISTVVSSLPGAIPPFSMAVNLAVDGSGNLYIVTGNIPSTIMKLSATTGAIAIVAGNGTVGYSGDGGPATSAEIEPGVPVVDSKGNLYFAGGNRVRKVDATTGIITTIAGDGSSGYSGDGGPAISAELAGPGYLAFDAAGNLYISDYGNNVIREVDAATKTITTVVGNGKQGEVGIGGAATSAELEPLTGLAVNSAGEIYFTENAPGGSYSYVLAVIPQLNITFATTPVGSSSMLTVPLDVNAGGTTITGITAPVSQGGKQEYVIGTPSCALNTALPAGTVCGVPVTFKPAYPGERLVPLQVATSAGNFNFGMIGLATGPQVSLTPGVVTTVAGNGKRGFSGNGGPATSAEFYAPGGLVLDSAGNLYIADNGNNQVRMMSAATGIVTNVAGSYTSGSPALSGPGGIALDAPGNLYIANAGNNSVVKVASDTGTVSTVAGTGTLGFSGDGGPATSAELYEPADVAVDTMGNLYITDKGNYRIRKVAADTGIITTVAGNGTLGDSGNGGPATSAELEDTLGLALDSTGDLYFTETMPLSSEGSDVRKIAAGTGIITRVAGTGAPGYSGDGGPATSAQLNGPFGIALDSAGNLYIADAGNSVIREVSAATGIIHTIAGNGTLGSTGDEGPSNRAEMIPLSVALDGAGNLYFANSYQNVPASISYDTIRKIDVTSGLLNFANTQVGTTSADSPQTATVSNIGNTQLEFTLPGTGMNPSLSNNNFTLGNSSTCLQFDPSSNPAKLASGDDCNLLFSFTPAAAGATSATATLADNALNSNLSTQLIHLNGTGTGSGTGTGGTTGDFALSVNPASQVVNSGSTATYTVTVSGMGGFSSPVALIATGLPPGATLSFTPAIVTPSGIAISGTTMATATLVIVTAASHAGMKPSGSRVPGKGFRPQFALLLLPLPLLGIAPLRKRLRFLSRMALPAVLAILSFGAASGTLTGCANVGLATDPLSYTIVVAGTSGALHHAANVTLTVNSYVTIRYK